MTYMPPSEEEKLLHSRHPEVPKSTINKVVAIAHSVRSCPDLSTGLSVRATEEACLYLKHPLMAEDPKRFLPEVLDAAFAGRFDGDLNDPSTDAGIVHGLIHQALRADAKSKTKKR